MDYTFGLNGQARAQKEAIQEGKLWFWCWFARLCVFVIVFKVAEGTGSVSHVFVLAIVTSGDKERRKNLPPFAV